MSYHRTMSEALNAFVNADEAYPHGRLRRGCAAASSTRAENRLLENGCAKLGLKGSRGRRLVRYRPCLRTRAAPHPETDHGAVRLPPKEPERELGARREATKGVYKTTMWQRRV